jgi:protein TonB
MDRNDWIGLGTSLAVHIGLLLMFTVMTVASDPPPFGFVEVTMGEISPGQPAEQAVEQRQAPQPPQPESESEVQEEQPEEPQAEEQTPVELPDEEETPDDEVINEPEEEETVQPEPEEEEPEATPESQPEEPVEEEPQPLGQGDPSGTSGSPTSDEGSGNTEDRTAPFSIEGLNRDPQRAPLPDYPEQVNAVIRVEVWVSPDGRIVRMRPQRKANAELEQAVFRALRRWKFSELPPGVPQEEQNGTITFRFRLE